MNIFYKVTLRTLRKNRTRTAVTIIGILLSAALICAVTTFTASIYHYMLEYAVYQNGSWHGSAMTVDTDTRNMVIGAKEVERTAFGQKLGYAVAEGCKNEYKPYLYLLGMSEDFTDMMPVHLTEGRYPETAEEILLPEHLAKNGGVTHRLGDRLTLTLGNRIGEGDVTLDQYNPLQALEEENGVTVTERFSPHETRSYTVVGFYERPSFEGYSAPGYTALTVRDAVPAAEAEYDVWFSMRQPQETDRFMQAHHLGGETNERVLTFLGVYVGDGMIAMLTLLSAIVIALIVFGSVALIYNAFSISVSERTRQFGLLSSVGGTKKQIRRSVLFEAVVISGIGIPLGILVGVGGIGITLFLIGERFRSILGVPFPMRVRVSLPAILIAAALALFTVLLSAWIPSKRATRVSAVSAIRQSMDIKAKQKEVKTSRLTYRLFGLPGMLANKYYKRSRSKYRATVVSLFMSIVLFISASSFCAYMMDSVRAEVNTGGCDLRFYQTAANRGDLTEDQLLALTRDAQGITDAAYLLSYGAGLVEIKEEMLSDRALEQKGLFVHEINGDSGKLGVSTVLYFVDDAHFRTLLAEYHLNEAAYFNPAAPLAVAWDLLKDYHPETEKLSMTNVLKNDRSELTATIEKTVEGYYPGRVITDDQGTPVSVEYAKQNDFEEKLTLPAEEALHTVLLKTGKKLDRLPFYCAEIDGDFLILLYPYSLRAAVLPDADRYGIEYEFLSEDHSKSYTALETVLRDQGISGANLYDNAAMVEENRNLVVIVQVFAYGFILLISLIAAANVFNTISTNIALRRREFAMLKSVGMTGRGFNRMMYYECLLYGCKALLYGLPAAVGVTFLIYRAVSEEFDRSFYLPWQPVLIAVCSVFAVVLVTMMYAMRKVKRDNPIDALKNENL